VFFSCFVGLVCFVLFCLFCFVFFGFVGLVAWFVCCWFLGYFVCSRFDLNPDNILSSKVRSHVTAISYLIRVKYSAHHCVYNYNGLANQ